MIAALYVKEAGPYYDLPDVDPCPESRNAALTRKRFEEAHKRTKAGGSGRSVAIELGVDAWTLGRRLREGYDSGTPLIPEDVRQAASALRSVKRRKKAAGRPKKGKRF